MGFWSLVVLVVVSESVALNRARIAWVDVMRSLSAFKSAAALEGAMVLTELLCCFWNVVCDNVSSHLFFSM